LKDIPVQILLTFDLVDDINYWSFGLFFYLILQNYDLIIENYVYCTGKASHRLLKLAKKTKNINLPYVIIKQNEINNDYTQSCMLNNARITCMSTFLLNIYYII